MCKANEEQCFIIFSISVFGLREIEAGREPGEGGGGKKKRKKLKIGPPIPIFFFLLFLAPPPSQASRGGLEATSLESPWPPNLVSLARARRDS